MRELVLVSRRLVVGIALGTAVLTALICAPALHPVADFGDLRDIVQSMRVQLPYWSLPCGWLGAWIVSSHDPRSVLVGSVPGRPRTEIVGHQAFQISAAVFLGCLVGMTPVAIVAMVNYPFSSGEILGLFAMGLAVTSLVAVGALGSAVMGTKAGLVLGPLLCLVVTIAPAYVINDKWLVNQNMSVLSTAYLWSIAGPSFGEHYTWSGQLIQCLFFLLMALATAKAAGYMVVARVEKRLWALGGLAWLCIPIATMAIIAPIQPILREPAPEHPLRCEQLNNLTVCLYPRDEKNRDFVRSLYQPLVAYSGKPNVTVTQARGDKRGITILLARPVRDYAFEGQNTLLGAAWQLLKLPDHPIIRDGDPTSENFPIASLIAAELVRRSGEAAPPEVGSAYQRVAEQEFSIGAELIQQRLAKLTDAQFKQLLKDQASKISDYTITRKDLP